MKTTKAFRSPANRQLARAVVTGSESDFGRKSFEFAVNILVANATNGKIALPLEVGRHPSFPAMVRELVGEDVEIRYVRAKLPNDVLEEARERQEAFEARQARRKNATGSSKSRVRNGKTAKTGGKAAAEKRKREKAAQDRALREAMKGGSAKKAE